MPILLMLAVYAAVDFLALIMFAAHFGALPTLALVIGSAIVGIQLIRREGLQTLKRMSLQQGQMPLSELTRGSASLLAGILLVLPGPLSDLLGAVMLLPRWFGKRERHERTTGHVYDHEPSSHEQATSRSGHTLEGEYIERDPK